MKSALVISSEPLDPLEVLLDDSLSSKSPVNFRISPFEAPVLNSCIVSVPDDTLKIMTSDAESDDPKEIVSDPPAPVIVSTPPAPVIISALDPAMIMSAPAPPVMVSASVCPVKFTDDPDEFNVIV